MSSLKQVINFGAGPAKLPKEVLLKAKNELLNWGNTGMSVMEMSHRSAHFQSIIDAAERDLRSVLSIPDTHEVLFLAGGGTTQFAAIPLNFTKGKESTADYIVTGIWSKKAASEAKPYCKVNLVVPPTTTYSRVPCPSTWTLTPGASYVYYCDNETVNGVEFQDIPNTNGVPLIADMSSNICSRAFDVSKFAMVFGGAQKNIGPAGITICIIRKDFIGSALDICPTMLNYKIMAENKSLFNTPPTFPIYMTGLVFQWILQQGGIKEMERLATARSTILYKAIEDSNGYYRCAVDSGFRSRMNIPFRLMSEDLENKFIEEATAQGLLQLKGH
eukprot:Ihof_evm3s254 gene=Ihof_evmTU3s254